MAQALAVRDVIGVAIIDTGLSVIQKMEIYVKLWWKGSITARACATKCAESCKIGMVQLAESGAIAKAGRGVGLAIGAWAGGALGAMAGEKTGGFVGGTIEWLVKKLIGSKKDDDLKNAYKFLGVSNGASREAVTSAFKKKALEHHPDKGGNGDDFVKLCSCVALIAKNN